jgi:hypothetical protein
MVTSTNLLNHIFLLGFMPSWDKPSAAVVSDWLNESTGTQSHNRVVNLMDELRQVGTGMDKALAQGGAISSRQPKGVREANADLDRRHVAINESLTRYSFTPAITRVWLSREWRLSVYSSPVDGQYSFERRVHKKDKNSEMNVEHAVREADVALYVLILAAGGELDRIKQCENCFKWFYAERSNQKFCLESLCRQKKYAASPRFKVYRKLYMRKRRAKDKALAEKSPKRRSAKSPRRKLSRG